MKRILIALVCAVVFMATSAQAANGQMYASGNLAFGLLTDAEGDGVEISFDPGFGLIGAVGFDMGQFRVEGELAYRSYDIDSVTVGGTVFSVSGDLTLLSFMANGYFDIGMPNSPLTPYVGFGLGFVEGEVEISGGGSSSGTEIAYQLMLGAAFDISPQAALTVGYRYFGYTDNDGENVHELNLGARFYF